MADTPTVKRSQNFSANDCLLLAEVMGTNSGVNNLSRHMYLRHRFTNTITSSSKKSLWISLCRDYCVKAEMPREWTTLKKKWDNLVQTHRTLYSDYLRNQQLTGGGPCRQKQLSPLTEAVMSVVGKKSAATMGIAGTFLDSSFLLADSLEDSTVTSEMELDNEVQSASSVTEKDTHSYNLANQVQLDESLPLASSSSSVQVICCKCGCHRRLELLKEEKLKLQIQMLKRKLKEE